MVDAGRLDGPRAARPRSCGARTWTSRCSRRRAAGSSCAGMGYESNEASVFTNVSSDHLDLAGDPHAPRARRGQGDGLPGDEAGRPGGAQRRRPARRGRRAAGPRARRVLLDGPGRGAGPRAPPARGRARVGPGRRPAGRVGRRRRRTCCSTSPTCRSRWAASRGTTWPTRSRRRAVRGRSGRPASRSRTGCATSARRRSCRPGRLNLFRLGRDTVIVDFAHNEAGTEAILEVAGAIAARADGRRRPRRSRRSSAPPATARTTRSAASAGSPRGWRSGS